MAAAIALKQRLKLSSGRDINKAALLLDKNLDLKKDFESEMIGVMQKQMIDIMAKLKNAQTALEASAEGMRNSILGGDKAKKDSASIAVVDEYLKKISVTVSPEDPEKPDEGEGGGDEGGGSGEAPDPAA